jgi:hypothetical protein
MAQSLTPIPLRTTIVDAKGRITAFMRLRWQELLDNAVQTPTASVLARSGLTAALAATAILTVTAGGVYRVSVGVRKTIADGVASSAQVTLTWTDRGAVCTHTFPALTTDTNVANDAGSWVLRADAATDITIAVAYASTTPNAMTYSVDAIAERLV